MVEEPKQPLIYEHPHSQPPVLNVYKSKFLKIKGNTLPSNGSRSTVFIDTCACQAWIPTVETRSDPELSSTTPLQPRKNGTCSSVPTPGEPSGPANSREPKKREPGQTRTSRAVRRRPSSVSGRGNPARHWPPPRLPEAGEAGRSAHDRTTPGGPLPENKLPPSPGRGVASRPGRE